MYVYAVWRVCYCLPTHPVPVPIGSSVNFVQLAYRVQKLRAGYTTPHLAVAC